MKKIIKITYILLIIAIIWSNACNSVLAVSTKNKIEQEDEEVEINSNNGLSSINIKGLTLTPEFQTDIYEYTVEYIGQETKLNIEAIPTDESYEIEIGGNYDLIEGSNTITILVSDSKDKNVATYQLNIEKSLVDYEKLEKERKEKEQNIIKISLIVAGVSFIAIILLIVISRNEKEDETENLNEFNLDDDVMGKWKDESKKEKKKKEKGKRYI